MSGNALRILRDAFLHLPHAFKALASLVTKLTHTLFQRRSRDIRPKLGPKSGHSLPELAKWLAQSQPKVGLKCKSKSGQSQAMQGSGGGAAPLRLSNFNFLVLRGYIQWWSPCLQS